MMAALNPSTVSTLRCPINDTTQKKEPAVYSNLEANGMMVPGGRPPGCLVRLGAFAWTSVSLTKLPQGFPALFTAVALSAPLPRAAAWGPTEVNPMCGEVKIRSMGPSSPKASATSQTKAHATRAASHSGSIRRV